MKVSSRREKEAKHGASGQRRTMQKRTGGNGGNRGLSGPLAGPRLLPLANASVSLKAELKNATSEAKAAANKCAAELASEQARLDQLSADYQLFKTASLSPEQQSRVN